MLICQHLFSARLFAGSYLRPAPHISFSGPQGLGVLRVKGTIEERAEQLALYIIENQATVRSAAKQFGISKSTVHKDISDRLPAYNRPLYLQVKKVLDRNKAERHLRGGLATRKKYKGV
jgi:putative DeoR family transcriptional regulator (stage III sporulation protein D)